VAVRAHIAGRRFEAIAMAVRACNLADMLLMADRHSHITPLRGDMRAMSRSITETARDKPGTRGDKTQSNEREPTLHRAPSG
jgi:hypothetical protein